MAQIIWEKERKRAIINRIIRVYTAAAGMIVALFILGGKLDVYGMGSDYDSYFENSRNDRLPQTIVSRVVTDFLKSPLPKGKEEKKVMVMGYDGFCEDGLELLLEDPQSSVRLAAQEGGLYHTYAGGEEEMPQQTTTAPGWASILTGYWAEETGVYDCRCEKNADISTFLMKAALEGRSAVFAASWDTHFSVTYRQDRALAGQRRLPLTFIQGQDDSDTYQTVLEMAAGQNRKEADWPEDPDIIFFILEGTDEEGHRSGYGIGNDAYKDACLISDACGRKILEAIRTRDTFLQEDWLILVTTDHGGIGTSHGGQTPEERSTWLASSKKIE